MSQGTKTTSLDKVKAALTEHGWTFTTAETTVSVPDTDNPRYSRYSSRASYPNKQVPGVKVEARNHAEGQDFGRWGNVSFTVVFTGDGKYLAADTRGRYPVTQGVPLKKVLETIEGRGPEALAQKEREEAEYKAQQLAEYDAKVAAAYAEAQEALSLAKGEMIEELVFGSTGLTHEQAEKTIEMVLTGKFGPVMNASTKVQNTSQGYLGDGYTPAKYVDGKRVEGSEF